MSATLPGRHAVITGASRGIGAAIARALAAEGARVSLIGRDAAALAQVAEDCAAVGATRGGAAAHSIVADVSDAGAVERAMSEARARFGPVQVLVNNAGQAASAKFVDTDPELWNRIMAVNLTGTYLCTRAAVGDMLEGRWGRIVNIASTAGLRGGAYLSAYASSKHAVVGLTRALALEYATRGITVNAVCPGYVDTDIVKNAVANISRKTGRSADEALATLLATNPQGRLVTSDEVAAAVLYLCRQGSESVTGQSLVLSGGEVT
jgi:NAD(P)-dependent dehydrogenase (short-subunit alcohol dehydrogenase family)